MRPTSLWLRIPESKVYQMSYAAVPLIISGVIVQSADDRFRDMRNNYLPRVRFHTDDYLQYAPAALMLGLKAAGLPGRSSWGRMLVSDAISTGIMAITINSLKYTCRVMRPDGSSRNSFPSGHTATAFMTATMLHKEYGLTHSPWYSIGGYAVATLTGLMRIANNKHYLSDVMVGAGVGILSAELGYWLADLIFKKRGMVSPERMEPPFSMAYRPSFLGLYLGIDALPGVYRLQDHSQIRFSIGSCIGVEGAWFWNAHWGAGGRLRLSSLPWTLNGHVSDNNFNAIHGAVGFYGSLPITSRWLVGTKLLCEYTYSLPVEFAGHTLGSCNAIGAGTGLSLTFRAHTGMGLKFFTDYTLSSSPVQKQCGSCHTLSLGGVISVLFGPN